MSNSLHSHYFISPITLFHFLSPCLLLLIILICSLSHLASSSPLPLYLPCFFLIPLHLPHLFISYGFFPYLFISHGFFPPLPLYLSHLFISHGSFPHLFISSIDCTLNLLFKLSTTHCPNNWWCYAQIFFLPLCFCGGLCIKDTIFSPFALWFNLWIFWYVLLLGL